MWNKLKEIIDDSRRDLLAAVLKHRKFFLGIAGVFGIILAFAIYCLFHELEKTTLHGTLTVLFLGLPTFFVLWLFRTHDVQQQLNKTQENTNNSSFFESARMLMDNNLLSRKIALEQLSFLKTNTGFDKNRIDLLTRGFPLRTDLTNNTSMHDNKTVFTGAVLRGLDLSNINFSGLDLTNADLQNAILKNATFHDANLTDADLRGANLCGAKLDKSDRRDPHSKSAIINGVKWKGAIYNDDTTFPEGFDPKKEGIIKKPTKEKEST